MYIRQSFLNLLKKTLLTRGQLYRLSKIIHVRLNYPGNEVGLEGYRKHSEVWETWLAGFIDPTLDAACIGGREVFWNAGDEAIMDKLVRGVVKDAAASIRNLLRKGPLPKWMIEDPGWTQNKISTEAEPDYGSDGGNVESMADSGSEGLSGSGSEEKEEEKEEASTSKAQPSNHTPQQQPTQPMPAKKRRKTEASPPEENGAAAATATLVPARPFTFMTRLKLPHTDVVRHEFIDTTGVVTLPDFTKLLRESNGMLPDQHIKGFEVEIGDRTIDIDTGDPEGEWDWGLVLGILHFSGLPDGLKAYVDIRLEA